MDSQHTRDVEHASDPRLIPGIHAYCHRRCERCPFTDRCLTFRDMRDDEVRHLQADAARCIGDDVVWTSDVLKADDLLFAHTRAYAQAAFELVAGLDRLTLFHEWPPQVRAALDTIGWYANLMPPKVQRALVGLAECRSGVADEDEIQNDWNGSAKVARLAVAESQRAWDTLLLAGEAPADTPLRATRALLDRIDRELAARFPRAMEFIRPGFDEPKIAAGALSTRGNFEPRRQEAPQAGVIAWLQRIAGAWHHRS
jgi:hypothetical protein